MNLGEQIKSALDNANLSDIARAMGVKPSNLFQNFKNANFGSLSLFIRLCIAAKKDLTPIISQILEKNGVLTTYEHLQATNELLTEKNRLLAENNRLLMERLENKK